MTTEDIILAIVTTLNVLSVIINICSVIKMSHIEADTIIESAELDKKKNLVMPVAEIKAEISEEDMKKFKEVMEAVKNIGPANPSVEDKKVECNHLYGSIVLMDDPINCREKLVFHCDHCCHEEIIPIKRGLMTKFFLGGGSA